MIIKRKLFTSNGGGQNKKLDTKDKIVGTSVAVGTAYGTIKVANKSITHFRDKILKGDLKAADAEEIKKKLLKEAKGQGIKVVEAPEVANAAYTGGKLAGMVKKGLAAGIKAVRKVDTKQAKEISEALKKKSRSRSGSDEFLKHFGKDAIVLGKDSVLSGADVVSHELGHAQYMKNGRSKNIVTKAAHSLSPLSSIATSKAGIGLSAAHGFASGVKSQRLKDEGKKESTWNKVKSVAIPAAAVAPLLITEGGASLNGLKRMKKLGASKQLMKESRRNLGNAYGTYVTVAATPVISGEVGRLAGKGYGKLTLNKKDNEEKNKS